MYNVMCTHNRNSMGITQIQKRHYNHVLGAFLYYYRLVVAVNRNGGGVIIPLSSLAGQ